MLMIAYARHLSASLVLITLGAIVPAAHGQAPAKTSPAMSPGIDKTDPFFRKRNSPEFDEAVRRYVEMVTPKIFHGSIAPNGSYPWQVSLGVSEIDAAYAHFCGGSIYSNRWVVTAAHCVINLTKDDIKIAFGSQRLTEQTSRASVRAIYRHPNFDPNTLDYDIALIELDQPISFSSTAQPLAPLDTNEEDGMLVPNRELLVAGWGATETGDLKVRQLRQVPVLPVTRKRCNDPLSYNGVITDNMICAQGKKLGDSCEGDSGGALVVKGAGSPPRHVGIVSAARRCAEPGKYGIYARVTKLAPWIVKCVTNTVACR